MRAGLVMVTLAVVLALATPAVGGEPTDTLRRLFDDANRILVASDATDDARLTGLRALLREAFDARAAAALALGRAWTSRTAAEREEFSRLYSDVMESAYLGGVGARARLRADGIRVAFDSESVQGTSATVVTTLETRGGDPMPIEYRLTRGERDWAVVDVIVDGLSLAGSYRAQVQRVMQSGTYADLLARLREKATTTTRAAIAAGKTATALATRITPPSLAATLASPGAEIAAAPVLMARVPASISDAPPVAAPVASEGKSFWIQVGAFRDTDGASRVVERLRSRGVIVAIGGPRSEPLARVLVGPFTDRAAAVSALRDLAAGGYPAFIAVE
jgi:phospholipid transport system substrate-binding protein